MVRSFKSEYFLVVYPIKHFNKNSSCKTKKNQNNPKKYFNNLRKIHKSGSTQIHMTVPTKNLKKRLRYFKHLFIAFISMLVKPVK